MDALLTQRIELARIEARRRGHPATEPEHLLAAILDAPEVTKALRDRGLDPIELHERAEARLAAGPALGGYRNASDVPTSPALRRVIERLTARRWRWLGARITYLDALMPEPSIASLVFELRRGNDYRHVFERAVALAVMSAHASVGIEHVFRVLLDLPSFVETLERGEGDVARLRDRIDTTLAGHTPSPTPSRAPPPIGPALRRVVSSMETTARSAGTPAATIRQLCLSPPGS